MAALLRGRTNEPPGVSASQVIGPEQEMDIRSLTSPAPASASPAARAPVLMQVPSMSNIMAASDGAGLRTDGLPFSGVHAEHAGLLQRVQTLTVRNRCNPRVLGRLQLNWLCIRAVQNENTLLQARMAELEQALQGARRTVTQAIQAAQAAQAGQRVAEAQVLQAQQDAQAARTEAQVARTARQAQAAQLSHAVDAMVAAKAAQGASAAQLQPHRTSGSGQPGDTTATTSSTKQPAQAQRSDSTLAIEQHNRRPRAKAPNVARKDSSSSLSSLPQRASRAAEAPATAATAASAELESSAADDKRSTKHDSLGQSRAASLIPGRGRARVGGSLIAALATEGDYLIAAGGDDSLWKRSLSARSSSSDNDTSWEHIGSAVNVVAMATFDRRVYALDSSSSIWCLDLYGSQPRWELWDDPPPPMKQHGIELPERRVSLTTTPDGYIWVATLSNNLLRASVDQGAKVEDADSYKSVCWERVRESVGVSGLVVIPTGSSTKTDCLLIAACENSKMWHWKPPRAAGDDASQKSTGSKQKVWCPCGVTPVKPDRGIAYANGRIYVTGPNGIHVAETGDVQEDAPASLQWSSEHVPLPPISINTASGPLTDRYSPSREAARPQLLGKDPVDVQGSKADITISQTSKKTSASKLSGKNSGRKSTSKNPHVQLKSSDGKEYFEVERILDKRPIQGKKRKAGLPEGAMFEYKVKWLNFDKPTDNTWEPWENICTCREVLAAYEGTTHDSNTRMRVGGKKPRGAQNTVTGSGFVEKRPRSSTSKGNSTLASTSAHRSHDTAANRRREAHGGTTSSKSSPSSTAKRSKLPPHTVQRPQAQRLAKTAALHPSVAAEYQHAEADDQTGSEAPTVRYRSRQVL